MIKFRVFAALALLVGFSGPVLGVSMNFSGHFRTETTYYNKLGLGLDMPKDKSFASARALLTPNVVIDDHFSLKSQWNLLTSPGMTPDATQALGGGQGGYVFGDTNTSALVLNRVWLEWTSDVGVLSVGRMPFSWGYGLQWDAGNGIWDDFQTTLDRIEYRLHLGNIVGALAYSKNRKGTVLADLNDAVFITAYLQYNNPESDTEAGILYENQYRSGSQTPDLMSGGGNPYRLPTTSFQTGTPYPLATKFPSARRNSVIDLYVKKKMGYFSFGGEFGWLTGESVDFNGDGKSDDLNGFGVVGNAEYEYHKVKAFLEVLYASGESDLTQNRNNGFVALHRNRRPGLILGRELLGLYNGNTVAQGSCVVYGGANTFSGCLYFRPGIRYAWSPTLSSGLEVIIARKASKGPGEDANLGVELDAGTDYTIYQNFDLGVNLAYLFPGKGLGVADPQGVIAFRSTLAVKF